MVEVTRAFFQCLTKSCDEVISELSKKFEIKSVYKSKVVPNFVMMELSEKAEEVERVLEELGLEDFKVTEVKV